MAFVRSSPSAVDNTFRSLQFISAALYSLGHGGNDAQKTMGIIAVLLYSQGLLGETFYIPFWVVLSCQAVMGLGTLVGGWRIVRTMGSRITRLHPVQGFCAEAGGAITLFLATYFGIPVSTTHTISCGFWTKFPAHPNRESLGRNREFPPSIRECAVNQCP